MSGPLGTSGGGAAGVTSVTAGNGITVTGTTTPTIAASLAAGTGIGISGTTTLTVSATGVNSVSGGTGISVSGTTALTVSATGVNSVSAGTGISVSGSTSLTVTNTGVTSLTGTGVTVSASTGAVTITAPVVAGGTGISVSGSQTTSLSIANTGVTALAGTGISVSAATGSVTVTPTYAAPTALTIGGTVVTGAAASVSNSAHVHAMPGSAVAGASAVGDTAATGSATTVALSDHRHSREAFGTPVVVNGQTTSLATGSLTTLARADHVHTVSNVPVLLASTTVTSAISSVTFSSIPQTYSHLWLLSRTRSSYVGTLDFAAGLFNGDAIWSNSNYVANSSTNSYINLSVAHGTTNVFASRASAFSTYIFGYSGSDFKYIQSTGSFMNGTTGYPMAGDSYQGEVYMSTTAITSMQVIFTGGGNFLSGTTFRLYGLP